MERSLETDWFCRCCQNHFKRENATMLTRGTAEHARYCATGMCEVCYKQVNGSSVREQLEELNANNEKKDNASPI